MIRFRNIKWKNFLSTGNFFTEVDLQLNSGNLIIGENGTGKSTLLDALTFSLFGKPYRKINKPQLINSINEKDCLVEVAFEIGSNSYTVRRGMRPHVFEIYLNGSLLDQDSKIKDYQERLEKNILKFNYKSFTQIIILGSSSFQPFMRLPAYIRREVIEDLLDIQVFSKMNLILKERFNDNKKVLSTNQDTITLIQEKVKLQKKYIKEVQDINDNKLVDFERDLKNGVDEVVLNKENIEKLLQEIDVLTDILIDKTDYETDNNVVNGIIGKIAINSDKNDLDIDFFKQNETCPTCTQDIDLEFKTEILEIKNKKQEEYKDAVKELEQKQEIILNKLDEYKIVTSEIQDKNKKIQQLQAASNGLQKFNTKITEQIEYLNKVYKKAEGDQEKLEGLVSENTTMVDERKQLLEYSKYLNVISDLLKDTGVKTTIIKQYLPIINKLINEYLTVMGAFFNFTLDENFDEKIYSLAKENYTYNSFSEGEKLRIDLALMFTWRAISKIKNNTNSNILILDEIFDSSLDSTGVELFFRLLHLTQKDINVFIITHKDPDLFTDKFDSILKFEKKGKFSMLKEIS